MGKSYKKEPVIKDKKPRTNVHNKLHRRKNSQALHRACMDEDLEMYPVHQYEACNQWDICYWSFRDEDNDKFYRK